ncbi:MAG: hypothetical protein PHW18_10780 [Sulfuricurvum sp.]|uniref:hypothetical protein n=1 Tax=Sulfuricurvum sp. TaxID=2025608 RepID=UPI002619D264|nr:hypothetical protein [Sulfuricurvum sp.]MDD2830047.1 hypothetical protein [Sulfuricurvum sp.]MDD4948368.1 hypothetical protein [Sulfuricurvum sp.]
MTITVKDSFADQVMAFLKTLPKDAVEVESSRPWYADEVKRRADQYRAGDMETVPHNEMWESIERQIKA